MTRRCSHCCNNGHNSRTCPSRTCSNNTTASASAGGVRLFGVRLTDGSIMKKSASMGNLSGHFHSHSPAAVSPNQGSPSSDPFRGDLVHEHDGYLSDDPLHATCSSNLRGERKKGVPWTEEEHRRFLLGLQKLGKGDWRGISRDFVMTRTPTQVASHAQKHFIRQSNISQRKRRSSLFDMVTDMAVDPQPVPVPEEHILLLPSQAEETNSNTANLLPSLDCSLKAEHEPMKDASQETVKESDEAVILKNVGVPPKIPGFIPAYLPTQFLWSSYAVPREVEKSADTYHRSILKPVPILRKDPTNVDELVGISQLSLGTTETGLIEPSPLSLKLPGESSRQSAFHASTPMVGQL